MAPGEGPLKNLTRRYGDTPWVVWKITVHYYKIIRCTIYINNIINNTNVYVVNIHLYNYCAKKRAKKFLNILLIIF